MFSKQQNFLQETLVSWKDLSKLNEIKWKELSDSINSFLIKEKYLENLFSSKNGKQEDFKYVYESMIKNKQDILDHLKYFLVDSDFKTMNDEIKKNIDYMESYLNKKLENYKNKILKYF